MVLTKTTPVLALAVIPFTFSGCSPAGGCSPRGNAADGPVVVVDVEDHDADAAVFDVVANTGTGRIKVVLLFGRSREGEQQGRENEVLHMRMVSQAAVVFKEFPSTVGRAAYSTIQNEKILPIRPDDAFGSVEAGGSRP
jgi:hypothetical protein